MAAAQPLKAVLFGSDTVPDSQYTLTSEGRLFVTRFRMAERPAMQETVQEVEIRVLALKILYQELARHIVPREEPEP